MIQRFQLSSSRSPSFLTSTYRGIALLAATLIFGTTLAVAQTDIYIKGAGRLIPVALPQLCLQSGDPDATKEIPRIIQRDLDLSGFFEVLDPNSYIESPGKCAPQESTVYSDWTVLGTEGLVKGVVQSSAGRIKIQMYLHDVGKHGVVLGKEYEGGSSDIPKIAHKFANEIMKFFTGEYGPFGTQISYSTKIGRFKELMVMDLDGSNARQITNERALALSSSWSPDGTRLVYTSYRNRIPDLFVIDIDSRRVSQVTQSTKLELGGKFTPDGRSILASISDGDESQIVIMNLNGQITRKLTDSNGIIDVSPHWSPDHSQVAFCSNRAGGPQIYTMNADGSDVKRVSFVTSNYCTSPSWSPKGDKIAFVCRAESGFQMFVVNVDGTSPIQVTSFGDNEDPDWSPDGRYLVFATTFGKGRSTSLALMHSDGTSVKQLTSGRVGDSQPSWGPRLD